MGFLEHSTLIAEISAIGLVLTVLLLTHRQSSKWLRFAERVLGRLGRRRALLITLVGLLTLGASMTLSLLGHITQPRVHDEFSYLLAGDTFARGRLTNPPHPLWVHFESIHIIQQPTYASKYPPGQGLMLALGQVIGSHPIVGVWISITLATVAVCWMLLAWLPAWWAVLGSLILALHPSILIQWGQTYWGGAVAMMGGALVFGAMRRIMRQPRVCDSLLLGLGLALLANSRPYEGLLASLPVAMVLLAWMTSRKGPSVQLSLKQIVLPIVAVLSVTGVAMGYYNMRVTGDLLRMPYLVHETTYSMAPFFLWQSARPDPGYRHELIRHHHVRELEHYRTQASLPGLAIASTEKLRRLWTFYKGSHDFRVALTIPLFLVPWVLRARWPRFALLTCGLTLVGLSVLTWVHAHYAAPIIGLIGVVVFTAMRHLHVWRYHGVRLGRLFVWTLCIVVVGFFIGAFAERMQVQWSGWGSERARILQELKKDGQRHLVFVRVSSTEVAYQEWVYNEADIDGAKVVWAREMDDSQNRKLLEHFKDRKVWLAEVDHQYDALPKLVPYLVNGDPPIACATSTEASCY